MHTCITCGGEYRPQTGARGECPKCYYGAKRRQRKALLIEMLGGECVACGYRKCLAALHFHHKDDNKEAGISRMLKTNMAWDKILREAAKCILLCANCHAEHHWGT